MKNFGRSTRGIGRALVLTLALLGWQLTCLPAAAQLASDEAVFVDFQGNVCGVVSATTMSVVAEFPCDVRSEAVDVTSDGTRAVIGTCGSMGSSWLTLVDLTTSPPTELNRIDSRVSCVQELDIAPDDSFVIVPGSSDGRVSKFTLEPSELVWVGTNEGYTDAPGYGASTQDVHILADGKTAVQPLVYENSLVVVNVAEETPFELDTIATTILPKSFYDGHHGISVSEGDNDTILATGVYGSNKVTVASLSSLKEIAVLPTPGLAESVDIKCDGSRAVVETEVGLMWLDMTSTPPSFINTDGGEKVFGPARVDYYSTSTVAFSADGTLLFVAGGQQIDVYDATVDPPDLLDSFTFSTGRNIVSVATLPCPTVPSEIEVAVDIKPGSCPNPLNVKSQGVVPVAILGTEKFDVLMIHPETIRLDGVSPLRWKLEDVATPYDDASMQGDCYDCTKKGPDGFLDLTLKFRTQDIVTALGGPVNDGDCIVLTLTGELFNETPIVGDDVVRINAKKKNPKKWFKTWLFSLLKEIKKGNKGNSCNIEKKKKHDYSKIKSNWHRNYKRH